MSVPSTAAPAMTTPHPAASHPTTFPTGDHDHDLERRRAARALLSAPLLTARDDDFRLVRKHAGELAGWFAEQTGWRLTVDAETARLFKKPAALDDATRPARALKTRVPFTRRRYVLLCLALAVLERSEAQTTLGRLAEGVLTGAAEPALADAGITFAMERREERADLVAVVRLLLSWGVLARVQGDEDAFVTDGGNDVLYDLDRRVTGGLLATSRGASTITSPDFEERLSTLAAEPVPETDELRLRSLRHAMTRRLLDDPVVYYADLTEAERAYLVNQRVAITRRIADLTGLVPEMRAEGIAMVDPDDALSDVRMPEQGTDGHVTLLIATRLATDGKAPTLPELTRFVQAQAKAHASYWRKTATEPAAAADLAEQAVAKLEALNLVTRIPDDHGETRVHPRSALMRFTMTAPTIKKAGTRS
ncbi:TIGR02678 family protein [Catenulispora sp. NF23]|uniref:TIGR02678 family protein n=1 Tax=Catenulispora pinistramenti TaxID=2705254 RepID=A0ABS5KIR0_9ACTN|nr:TIGR02678 family protein [Catenulispora pinistramenti]MBS2535915.1 TIGR02678 family protein [Catenulispora pinistramenti]MBS2546273.1 TIGR02678 family protein [Catenulispora pinistramenti]